MGNEYNSNKSGGKSASDGFREGPKGKQKAAAPSYKDGENINAKVPKLKQQKGVVE